MSYERILITLDGSNLSRQALPQAQYLAQSLNASLLLLQVVPDLESQTMRYATEPMLVDMENFMLEQQTQLVEQTKTSLEQVAADLRDQGIHATAFVEVGDPAVTILEFASKNNIDVIVMSTHGRTGFQRWVHGSVANKILQGAVCPVLLVRASQEQSKD